MECAQLKGVVLAIIPEISKIIRISAHEHYSEVSSLGFNNPLKSKEENTLAYVDLYKELGYVICSETWFHTNRLKALQFLKSQVTDFNLFI
jgi:hypothetical protein